MNREQDVPLVAVIHGRGMYECRPLATVWIDVTNNSGEEDSTLFAPFNTLDEGYGFIGNGADMVIKDGDHVEGARVMRKRITLRGDDGPAVVR